MRAKQRGIGVLGGLCLIVGIVVVAVLAIKIVPAYIEYFTVKKIVADLAQSELTSPKEIRDAFRQRASVEYFDGISPNNLVVDRDGIRFAYEKRIPLFANLTLVIDFEGASERQ